MQLEIKDNKWQLCWGTGALETLCDELDISLQDIDVAIISNETATLNRLVYCALKNGAEINDSSLDFNYKYFLNWLDEQPEDTGKEIMGDFMASKLLGKTMQSRFDEIIERLNASVDPATVPIKKKNTPSAK